MTTGFPIYPGGMNPSVAGGMPMQPPALSALLPPPAMSGMDTFRTNPVAYPPEQQALIPPGAAYTSPSPLARTITVSQPRLVTAEILGSKKDVVTPEILHPGSLPSPWSIFKTRYIPPSYIPPYNYPSASSYAWAQPPNPAAQPVEAAKSAPEPPPAPPPKAAEQKLPELPKPMTDAESFSPQFVEERNQDLEAKDDETIRKQGAERLAKALEGNKDILDVSKPHASRTYRPYAEALIIKALKDVSPDVRRPVLLTMMPGGLNIVTPRILDSVKQLTHSSADQGIERKLAVEVLRTQSAKTEALQNIKPMIPAQALVENQQLQQPPVPHAGVRHRNPSLQRA